MIDNIMSVVMIISECFVRISAPFSTFRTSFVKFNGIIISEISTKVRDRFIDVVKLKLPCHHISYSFYWA